MTNLTFPWLHFAKGGSSKFSHLISRVEAITIFLIMVAKHFTNYYGPSTKDKEYVWDKS